MTRSGALQKSLEVKAQAKGKGKKQGRKRKAEENSFKISDFVDSQVCLHTFCTCTCRSVLHTKLFLRDVQFKRWFTRG